MESLLASQIHLGRSAKQLVLARIYSLYSTYENCTILKTDKKLIYLLIDGKIQNYNLINYTIKDCIMMKDDENIFICNHAKTNRDFQKYEKGIAIQPNSEYLSRTTSLPLINYKTLKLIEVYKCPQCGHSIMKDEL